MGTSPVRIGLFGLFGIGNHGNDGSLEAMLDFLRAAKPDANVRCICFDPHKVQNEFRLPCIPIRMERTSNTILTKFRPIRQLLQMSYIIASARQFDVLIMPGTGILDDFSDSPWGMPFSLFLWCLAARVCGTKIAFVSAGAGPIANSCSRWLMKWAARMAHFRSYRDTVSKTFMQSIGLDTRRDAIYPDIAFSLPSPCSSTSSVTAQKPVTVGVGVMTYYGWRGDTVRGADIYKDYLAKLARFTMWLLDRGYRVRLLGGDKIDQQAVDDLFEALASERPSYPREDVVFETTESLHDLMRQIAETQLVVATRYHNIVCALKLSRPSISIGYAQKNDVLMAEMGLGEFCQHVEKLDVELLMAQFADLSANRAMYEQRLNEMNDVFRQRLYRQQQILLEALLS
jgi:polysaccharide pyruvyl transferase WcaK-like protein